MASDVSSAPAEPYPSPQALARGAQTSTTTGSTIGRRLSLS